MTTGWSYGTLTATMCGIVLLGACAQPTSGPTSRGGREPELRVAVVAGATAVRVGGEGSVVVEGSERFVLEPGDPIRVVSDGERVRIEDRAGSATTRVTVRGQDASSFVTINGQPYRGTVLVYSGSGGVVAVNVVADQIGNSSVRQRRDRGAAVADDDHILRTVARQTRRYVALGVMTPREAWYWWECARAAAGQLHSR